jgi:hypothetical protein
MLRKLRDALRKVQLKKNKDFDDFNQIIRRCIRQYRFLFPKYLETKDGSRIVYHFNVPGVAPISLEKPHGNREFVPHYYAKLAIHGIEDLLDFVEVSTPDEDTDLGKESDHESEPD